MRRRPNPDQRRNELCDAAIRLLADDGIKGVSHLKVDRKAGVPDGTTSFYFRTRSALLQAVAARVAELDLKDLTAATRAQLPSGAMTVDEPSRLATLVMRSATGARLVRTKARYELALQAVRDSVLGAALQSYSDEFLALIRDAVLRLQNVPNPELAEQQAYAVMMFLSGVMLAMASGDRSIRTAQQLDGLISGIVLGIGATETRG
ncbi:MAG TPA: TetR family transcriptional regulator [Mycobacterium sp.]|nr:TetR family transcriptional regulator [Mycobacterium sp.]